MKKHYSALTDRAYFCQALVALFAICAAALCSGHGALAEDSPRRGLLADGRAFRTDQNGNQLVDYIAELEVNVESLEKRVYGLEDEIKEKQAVIDRLQKGGAADASLRERDLGTQAATQVVAQRCPSCPQCPDQVACECPPQVDNSDELAALQRSLKQSKSQIEEAEGELRAVRIQLQSERENRSKEVASYEDALKKIEEPSKATDQQLAILRKNLEEYRLQLASEQSARKSLEERSKKLLSEKQDELEAKQNELETLRVEQRDRATQSQGELAKLNAAQKVALQKKQDELDKLQDRLAELQVNQARAQVRQESVPRSAFVTTAPVTERGVMSPASQPLAALQPSALVSARERAVAELRSQVSTLLAQLKMSIQTRDQLFAQFDQRGRPLQIRPSALRTSSGATPDSIRDNLIVATSVRDLLRLRDEVQLISRKVADDIATVRRLSGAGR
ncbi:MAG: hypothetical protein EBZ48_05930 [Proteobacteria bacterium]|nr:hypothetical protein [Pseudomonadota bacterium]